MLVDILSSRKISITDLGFTSHLLVINTHYTNIEECAPGIRVKCPNNKIMDVTHTALIDISNLPSTSQKCHIFQDMNTKGLLSIA